MHLLFKKTTKSSICLPVHGLCPQIKQNTQKGRFLFAWTRFEHDSKHHARENHHQNPVTRCFELVQPSKNKTMT
jgi:hypothetical protein